MKFHILFAVSFAVIIFAIFYRAGAAEIKVPKAKAKLPCRAEYKEIRLAQLRLDLALAKYGSCIEVLTEKSNEFL